MCFDECDLVCVCCVIVLLLQCTYVPKNVCVFEAIDIEDLQTKV